MDWIDLIIIFIKGVLVFGVLLLLAAYVTLAERRIAGFIQDRLGPNRVGPEGFLQPIADGIKNFMKEDIIPGQVHKTLFILAPCILTIPPIVSIGLVPFGTSVTLFGREITLYMADINTGILLIFAITSLGVYGIVLGGWASNSKYSLLGGLRSSAQMVSYEIAMGLSVIGVLMITQSLRLTDIVASQQPWWNVVRQPLGFLIFLSAALAETNRVPFDLPEAEPELVAGYHTEYSSMKFALFLLGEYMALVVSACLMVTLFFGGWHFPILTSLPLPPLWMGMVQMGVFFTKVLVFLFFFIWLRWTIPRFRYDQLMDLGWKIFLPLALLNIFITGLVMILA